MDASIKHRITAFDLQSSNKRLDAKSLVIVPFVNWMNDGFFQYAHIQLHPKNRQKITYNSSNSQTNVKVKIEE